MAKAASPTLQGDLLPVQPVRGEPGRDPGAGRACVLAAIMRCRCSATGWKAC